LNKKRPLYIKAKEKTAHLIKKLESARSVICSYVVPSYGAYSVMSAVVHCYAVYLCMCWEIQDIFGSKVKG